MLFYFRFREPYFSVSRTALTALDIVSLIKSALDDSEYGWLKESAAMTQIECGTLMGLKTLIHNLSPHANTGAPPDEPTRER